MPCVQHGCHVYYLPSYVCNLKGIFDSARQYMAALKEVTSQCQNDFLLLEVKFMQMQHR